MQPQNHPDHDLLLISAHAAGDLSGTEANRAAALLDACPQCADLHRDLLAIAAATRALPNLATAPRDFRFSPEQAAKLGRRGWLRRILAPFGSARSAARPVAAAFTSLGIAGLLVATFLPGMLGGAASAPTGAENNPPALGAVSGAPVPAATDALAPAAGEGGPGRNSASEGPDDAFGVKDHGSPASGPEIAVGGGSVRQAPGKAGDAVAELRTVLGPNPLLIGSLALLAVGLLLFGLRFAGRRLR